MRSMAPRLAAAMLLLLALPFAAAYEFDMGFQTRCIFEEIPFETSIAGRYSAFLKDHPQTPITLSLKIEDQEGRVLVEIKDAAASDFNIPKAYEGEYKLCFTARNTETSQATRISVTWREGVEATDWGQVAKRDNLDVIQTELMRLEESVHTIHLELQHIRRKEEEMRDVNEATNARVAYFSIGALVTCLAMAALQLWNMKRFFLRKKLL